jgi:hypothetical protein
MPKKLRVAKPKIKVRLYSLIETAVEQGVGYGWLRAHKHEDHPKEETVKDMIGREVMNSICELIDFEESS